MYKISLYSRAGCVEAGISFHSYLLVRNVFCDAWQQFWGFNFLMKPAHKLCGFIFWVLIFTKLPCQKSFSFLPHSYFSQWQVVALSFMVSDKRNYYLHLQLTYQVVYPMQIIFTENIMNTYSQFWSFFTRINCEYNALLEVIIAQEYSLCESVGNIFEKTSVIYRFFAF